MLQLTHRLLAWGVLGLATGGCLFLPTHPVVFRSIELENPAATGKFRGFSDFLGPFPNYSLSGSYRHPRQLIGEQCSPAPDECVRTYVTLGTNPGWTWSWRPSVPRSEDRCAGC